MLVSDSFGSLIDGWIVGIFREMNFGVSWGLFRCWKFWEFPRILCIAWQYLLSR